MKVIISVRKLPSHRHNDHKLIPRKAFVGLLKTEIKQKLIRTKSLRLMKLRMCLPNYSEINQITEYVVLSQSRELN